MQESLVIGMSVINVVLPNTLDFLKPPISLSTIGGAK